MWKHMHAYIPTYRHACMNECLNAYMHAHVNSSVAHPVLLSVSSLSITPQTKPNISISHLNNSSSICLCLSVFLSPLPLPSHAIPVLYTPLITSPPVSILSLPHPSPP